MSESDKIAATDDQVSSSADEKTSEQLWEELGFGGSGPAKAASGPADEGHDDDDDAGDGQHASPESSKDDAARSDGTETTDDAPSALDALKAQNERLEWIVRTQDGRLSAAARELADLKRRTAATIPDKGTSGDTDDDPSKGRKERLASTREEFPDIAGPVVEELESLRAEISSLREQSGRKASEDRAAAEQRISDIHEEQQREFLKEHADGFDVISKNAKMFQSWIEDQPKLIRDQFAINSEAIVDANGAALVVTRFKQALAEADASRSGGDSETRQQSRRERQRDGARETRGRRAPATTPDLPDDADPQELWAEMHRTGLLR